MKAVSIALFVGMVGCASLHPISAADAVSFREKVVHSFCSQGNCKDGKTPTASLIYVNGTLYGTASRGGHYIGLGCGGYGCGTAFALDPKTGAEKVLYAFCRKQNCADGFAPQTSLIDLNGMLYGTTYNGGGTLSCTDGCGTAFAIDTNTGAEKVLYSFCQLQNCADGANPRASLIAANGMLYGTTFHGGFEFCNDPPCGTVFSLDPNTGAEKVLYAFCSQRNCPDGATPAASVIDVNGLLYGTTLIGGQNLCEGGQGCGSVFSLDPNTGAEKTLHLFGTGSDGWWPEASLIAVNGTLYGTTSAGGGHRGCGNIACGTVFSIDPNTGAEKVVYAFCSQTNCVDGAVPYASLIAVNGTLYGTTYAGGATGCTNNAPPGCGTVFSLDPNTGVEKVLYSFCSQRNCVDGATPFASLISVNGALYGTTAFGGVYGFGTVFVIKKKR